MGQVWAAEDTRLKREVALKVLPPELADDDELRLRFQREAKAVAALDHPNIVAVHSLESATTDEATTHFITMQLVEGRTLGELIPEEGMQVDRFFDIARPLTDALCAAHRQGITHRDLKPSNIMVGNDGRVRVLDFGLAKPGRAAGSEDETIDGQASSEALTRYGTVLGTAPYMSPEQAMGRSVDPRSDIFSLGVVFHELIAGRRPFQGDNLAELLSAILRDPAPRLGDLRDDLPHGLSGLVARCLKKRPGERFQTAQDLHADLSSIEPAPTGSTRPLSKPSSGYADSRSSFVAARDRPSLAVVPFANLSDDPEQDHFAMGLWADINSDLVKISGLVLISQMSTQFYADKEVSPQQVASELGVRYVLLGTVRKAGNRIRITAELVDSHTGEPVWSDRFDGEIDNLFDLQDQITEEIVTALDVELVHGEASRIYRRSLKDPRARELFYRALPLIFSEHRESLRDAQHRLMEAARVEPSSPVPPTFAAWSHFWDARMGGRDAEATLARAAELAERAIELEDPSGMAQMLKGTIHLMRREHDQALEAAEVALEHRPSCPWAFALKGNIYNYTGRPAEAVDLAKYALLLTPLFATPFPAVLATGHYLCDQPTEAVEAARGAVELSPDHLEAHVMLTAALAATGSIEEADDARQELLRIREAFSLEDFAETQPFRDPADLESMLSDLRAAGLG